jgi:hypothetical protein
MCLCFKKWRKYTPIQKRPHHRSDNRKETRMPHLATALSAATATVLTGAFACLGSAVASADPGDVLTSVLSKGYSPSNCSAQAVSEVADAFPTVLAVQACGPNAQPNGPAAAKYFLFPSAGDTSSSFTKLIGTDKLVNCGSESSPTSWHQGSTTDTAGQVACGTDKDQAEVIWTNAAKNVLAFVRASNSDTASLFQWWVKEG